ncbi:dnaJ homolog subfamily C member 21 [Anopheles nili]|uniref:dnaJ homolog subfamily C member 21 n=1 Tax=Anopheles nili TaxID=185578 RepID=UPI00237BE772|nr:dnaJ homolog subfamily C member 21 [Anopheles nili]
MKCHYEVLGITRTAEADEIKKSYRKLALRWHPDKNLDNAEEANQQFLLVQAAYDVLSDHQERAWYDNHREQILRGGHTDYEDNSLDVFPYFTASCYKGFGDEKGGFYAVYAEVFDKLATEEVEFLDTEAEFEAIPKFGDSQSDYESIVRLFYGFWEGFCTKKSYAWLNPHNVSEIRDRRILKAIEKDNKKVQQKARKERNEEIRSLVLFVKKRDKRVQAYKKLLEEKATQNRLKSQQMRLEQIRRNQQEIEEQQRNSSTHFFNDAYEEQLRKLEAAYAEASEDESVDEEEQMNGLDDAMAGLNVSRNENGEESYYVDDLYCVACAKMFTNRSSYENHETSKKHKQNVELLRKQMREEQEEQDREDENHDSLSNDELENAIGSENEEEQELVQKVEKKPEKSKQKKNKGKKKALNSNIPVIKSSDDEENAPEDDAVDMIGSRLGRKGGGPGTSRLANSDDSDDWTGGGKKSNRKGKAKAKGSESSSKSKNTKAAPAAAKKDQAPEETSEVLDEPLANSTTKASELASDDDRAAGQPSEHACVTCREKFSSKNKLFDHLKKTGHSVYIDKLKPTKASGKGDGTKGKRKGK